MDLSRQTSDPMKLLFVFSVCCTSLANKRRQAGWNDNYRAKLVFGNDF